MLPHRRSLLTQLAWWNVGFHLTALALTWFFIRPGTPAFDVEARRLYLAAQPHLWSIAWGAWMICALLQVAFYAVLASYLPERRGIAALAVGIACAGAAIDLLCDTIWIVVLPEVAAQGRQAQSLFLVIERIAAAGGLVVANGLYVLAAFLLTRCLRTQPNRVPGTLAMGYGVFLFGILLTVSGFTSSQWLAEAATGPTILCFCAWVVLAARSVCSDEEPL